MFSNSLKSLETRGFTLDFNKRNFFDLKIQLIFIIKNYSKYKNLLFRTYNYTNQVDRREGGDIGLLIIWYPELCEDNQFIWGIRTLETFILIGWYKPTQ